MKRSMSSGLMLRRVLGFVLHPDRVVVKEPRRGRRPERRQRAAIAAAVITAAMSAGRESWQSCLSASMKVQKLGLNEITQADALRAIARSRAAPWWRSACEW